jgi:DNA-directed RNA polymerase subunit alpha
MSKTLEDIAGLITKGDVDAATARLGEIKPADSHTRVEKLHLEGLLHERQNDWIGAVTSYREALEVDPEHSATLFRLAYVLDLHGDDEEAIALYRRCLQDSPAHVNALMNLAVILEDRGDYREAYDLVERVVDEHPNHVRARLVLKDIESSLTMYYDEEREATREKRDALLDTPLSDFELSVRSRNCLKQMNLNTLGDLLRITEQKLLAYKNFGETSLNEIKQLLSSKSLRLGQALDEPVAPPPSAVPGPGGSAHTPLIAAGDPNLLNRSVAELELSVRSRKCLQRLGISTLGEMVQRSEHELLGIKNFGQTSLNEIKRRLGEVGLSLREVPNP